MTRQTIRPLSRRALLRGLGGTAVALPALEIMFAPRARAASSPKYLVCYGGISLGQGGTSHYVPKKTGAGYELTPALRPLGGRSVDSALSYASVQSEVSFVTGLKIPWKMGGSIPRAGRPPKFHSSTPSPLLSGTSALDMEERGYSSSRMMGPTSDQIVADVLGAGSSFRSLEYRVQPLQYREPEPNKGRISYRKDAAGKIVPNEPTSSPRVAYDQLFRGFGAESDPDAAKRKALLEQDKSVLDLVRGRADRLFARLGTADRQRLQRHFDEIRDLERRVREVAPPTVGGACAKTADPGEDPPSQILRDMESGDDRENGWSNEPARAPILCDLIHMAFTCGLTHVASLMFTWTQCFMTAKFTVGRDCDFHDTGHNGAGEAQMAELYAWHLRFIAPLIDKFRNTPDGDGTLLDHSAIVFLTEGGSGENPDEGGRGSHSSENMVALVAGRAGGLKPGRHIARGNQRHPAEVLLSAMKAVGYQADEFGEVTGGVPELFQA